MKIALLLVALYAIVGTLSYEDTVAEAAQYCEMVAYGYWPDYRKVCGL